MSDNAGPCGVPRLLTVADAAEAAHVTERTMWSWLNSGRVPKRQPGGPGTRVLVLADDLLRVAGESSDDTNESEGDS